VRLAFFAVAGGAFACLVWLGGGVLMSALAALGTGGLVVVSAISAMHLGRRRGGVTAALGASVGPLVALTAPQVTGELALALSVSSVYLALYLRAEVSRARTTAGPRGWIRARF